MILVKSHWPGDGRSITFSITASETVGSLKSKLQEQQGIPADEQRLILGGVQLEDNRMFGDYSISEMSTLHLLCA